MFLNIIIFYFFFTNKHFFLKKARFLHKLIEPKLRIKIILHNTNITTILQNYSENKADMQISHMIIILFMLYS